MTYTLPFILGDPPIDITSERSDTKKTIVFDGPPSFVDWWEYASGEVITAKSMNDGFVDNINYLYRDHRCAYCGVRSRAEDRTCTQCGAPL